MDNEWRPITFKGSNSKKLADCRIAEMIIIIFCDRRSMIYPDWFATIVYYFANPVMVHCVNRNHFLGHAVLQFLINMAYMCIPLISHFKIFS